MTIVVRVESTADQDAQAGNQVHSFMKDEVTLGRASTNDIVLADARISSKHARIVARAENGGPPALFVTDRGSSNGTFLEEERLPVNVERKIGPNQRLVMGSFVIQSTIASGDATGVVNVSAVREAVADSRAAPVKKPPAKAAPVEAVKNKPFDLATFAAEQNIKKRIHDELIERLELRRRDIATLSEADLRARAREKVEQIIVDLRWDLPEGLDREQLIKQVLDEALGLGPLEVLLAEEEVSEIMVNNYAQIYAERDGKLELTDLRYTSETAVLGTIERILAPIGRRVDEGSPLVDARLKDGSRVNAVIRPLALRGPCITIRKFKKDPLTSKDLVRFGAYSQGMSDFLMLAVESRLNIVISGGTGSGKTTLLNVISSFIPGAQRVITVEDAAELRLPQEHVISFETRPPNLEGKGSISIRDLVKNALRMRPDRIIVGECRGAEALDMLQAMNTGHDGSMTTGHANSPTDMIRRLETMVLTAGLDLPVRAVREQIASAVNIVLQQTRFGCGTRKVTAISEIVGMDYDEGTVILEDIFLFKQKGYGEDGKIIGNHQATGYIPKFFRKLQERGLPVNADVFNPSD